MGLQHARLPILHYFLGLFRLVTIESVMPSNHLFPCHPLLILLSIFPSVRVFSNKSTLHIRWPKYWCFSFTIRPSNEYSEFGWSTWFVSSFPTFYLPLKEKYDQSTLADCQKKMVRFLEVGKRNSWVSTLGIWGIIWLISGGLLDSWPSLVA